MVQRFDVELAARIPKDNLGHRDFGTLSVNAI